MTINLAVSLNGWEKPFTLLNGNKYWMDYLISSVTWTKFVAKTCRDAAQIYWFFVGFFFFVLQLLLKSTFKICQAVMNAVWLASQKLCIQGLCSQAKMQQLILTILLYSTSENHRSAHFKISCIKDENIKRISVSTHCSWRELIGSW